MNPFDQDKAVEHEIDMLIRDLNALEHQLRLVPSNGLNISQMRARLRQLQSRDISLEEDWYTHVPTDRIRR